MLSPGHVDPAYHRLSARQADTADEPAAAGPDDGAAEQTDGDGGSHDEALEGSELSAESDGDDAQSKSAVEAERQTTMGSISGVRHPSAASSGHGETAGGAATGARSGFENPPSLHGGRLPAGSEPAGQEKAAAVTDGGAVAKADGKVKEEAGEAADGDDEAPTARQDVHLAAGGAADTPSADARQGEQSDEDVATTTAAFAGAASSSSSNALGPGGAMGGSPRFARSRARSRAKWGLLPDFVSDALDATVTLTNAVVDVAAESGKAVGGVLVDAATGTVEVLGDGVKAVGDVTEGAVEIAAHLGNAAADAMSESLDEVVAVTGAIFEHMTPSAEFLDKLGRWADAFAADAAEMAPLSDEVKRQFMDSAPSYFPAHLESQKRITSRAQITLCYAYVSGRGGKKSGNVPIPEPAGSNEEARARDEARKEIIKDIVGEGLQHDLSVTQEISGLATGVVTNAVAAGADELVDSAGGIVDDAQAAAKKAKKVVSKAKEMKGKLNAIASKLNGLGEGIKELAGRGEGGDANSVADRLERATVANLSPELREAYWVAKEASAAGEGKGVSAIGQVALSKAKDISVSAASYAINNAVGLGLTAIAPGLSTLISIGAKMAQMAAKRELSKHNEFKDCVACYATASAEVLLDLFPNGKIPPVFCGTDISELLAANTPKSESYSPSASALLLQAHAQDFSQAAEEEGEAAKLIAEEVHELQESVHRVFISSAIKRVLQAFTSDQEAMLKSIKVAGSVSQGDYYKAMTEGVADAESTSMVHEAFEAQLARADAFWHAIVVGEVITHSHLAEELSDRAGSKNHNLRPYLPIRRLIQAVEHVYQEGEDDETAKAVNKFRFLQVLPQHFVDALGDLPLAGFCSKWLDPRDGYIPYDGKSITTHRMHLPILGFSTPAVESPLDIAKAVELEGTAEAPIWLTTNFGTRLYRRLPVLPRPQEVHHNLYDVHEQEYVDKPKNGHTAEPVRARVGYVTSDSPFRQHGDEIDLDIKSSGEDGAPRFEKQHNAASALDGRVGQDKNRPVHRALLLEDLVHVLLKADATMGHVSGMKAGCKVLGLNVRGTVDDYVELEHLKHLHN